MTDQEFDDQGWWETLADVRELPATAYMFGVPGPQNVAVTVTLPNGEQVKGTAVIDHEVLE